MKSVYRLKESVGITQQLLRNLQEQIGQLEVQGKLHGE